MKKVFLLLAPLLLVSGGCRKTLDLADQPVPAGTLVLEFAAPVRYVMDLSIDGSPVPIRFVKRNRVLRVEGLQPGVHTFNIHSISYVFGPEFERFQIAEDRGAYFFIQQRKYRSGLPKRRANVSIRAYRRDLKKQGIDVREGVEIGEAGAGKIKAYFAAN